MKYISLLLLTFIGINGLTQVDSYKKYINGSFGVNFLSQSNTDNSNKPDGSTSSGIFGRFGFMRSEIKAMGIGVNISHTYRFDNAETSIGKSLNVANAFNFELDFFIRRFKKLNDNFYLTLDYGIALGGGPTFQKTEITTFLPVPITTTSKGIRNEAMIKLYAFPSILYFPKPSWALELSIGQAAYSLSSRFDSGYSNVVYTNKFGLSMRSTNITFGLTKFF